LGLPFYREQQETVASEPVAVAHSSALMTAQLCTEGQSVSVTQVVEELLAQVPCGVQVSGVDVLHATSASADLPQVECAAHGTTCPKHCLATPAPFASDLVALATQLTYCPWLFHGTTPPCPSGLPVHGQEASIASLASATAVVSQVGGLAALVVAHASTARIDNGNTFDRLLII
jgi:hypothetical protein